MSELKTRKTGQSVAAFLNAIEDEQKRRDCKALRKMMEEASGRKAAMWGNMVGFGAYHFRYASGRDGSWFLTGFAPRKQNLVIYFMPGFSPYKRLMDKLGNYTTGKCCLYIKRLADIDSKTLRQLVSLSVKTMEKKYKTT